jgi:fatty acid-binding protein DegV
MLGKMMAQSHHYTMLISHTSTAEKVNAFASHLQDAIDAKINNICETAPSVGVHAGRGSIAVAMLNEGL